MRRLAICREAPPRCLKKPIDGFLDSPYISYTDIAKISKRVQHARGPRRTVASGALRSPKENHLLLFKCLSSAGDRVLIGAPSPSKELSSLQETSYVSIPRKFATATPQRCAKGLRGGRVEPHGCIHGHS